MTLFITYGRQAAVVCGNGRSVQKARNCLVQFGIAEENWCAAFCTTTTLPIRVRSAIHLVAHLRHVARDQGASLGFGLGVKLFAKVVSSAEVKNRNISQAPSIACFTDAVESAVHIRSSGIPSSSSGK